MTVDLSDAIALAYRSQHHLDDYNAAIDSRHGGLIQIRVRNGEQAGEFIYSLFEDRQRLIKAKPILADAATNVISSLDNVAGAIARSRGHGRLRSLYFPMGLTDDEFEGKLDRARRHIGDEMAEVISKVRAARYEHVHAEAAKEISYSGKHWELMPTFGAANAIAITRPGLPQRIFQIPGDAFASTDEHIFHQGEYLSDRPMQLLYGFKVEGLPDGLPTSPDTIIQCALRYARAVIDAVCHAAEAGGFLATSEAE